MAKPPVNTAAQRVRKKIRKNVADGVADLLRRRAADAVDGGQADLGVLVGRNVDAGYACHGAPLSQP